jgi:aspartate-semialdehyde dehydrogenase
MTITHSPSAPLVAVVGATGTQGGSVIKALEESGKPYRIRGFTRDATKPSAQGLAKRGVEVVTISLVVDNAEKVYASFSGANIAFASFISELHDTRH